MAADPMVEVRLWLPRAVERWYREQGGAVFKTRNAYVRDRLVAIFRAES